MSEAVAEWLDRFRAEILRRTLAVGALRGAFRDRASRLSALFALSLVFSLVASLLFPFWVLALGPLTYGVPHLFASIRFFHYDASPRELVRSARIKRRIFAALFAIMAALAIYHLGVSFAWIRLGPAQLSEWKGAGGAEMLALAATVAAATTAYRRPAASGAVGLLALAPLLAAFVLAPLSTIGALILLHNYVGFAYWYRAASSRAERRAAAGAFAAAVAVTALVFAGALDWACPLISPGDKLPFARMSFPELGRMIFPRSAEPRTWIHATIVYAFGQSLHYYVWLKAIPDQRHSHAVPTSFRESLKLLKRDFGGAGWVFALLLSLLGVSAWLFVSFYPARVAYFAFASYHGYLEIAGLALAAANATSHLNPPISDEIIS